MAGRGRHPGVPLPLASLEHRQLPRARDVGAALTICAGLATLYLAGAAPVQGEANRDRVVLASLATVGLVVILVLTANHMPNEHGKSVLLAAAAGLGFAMTAVFMTLTAHSLRHRGVAATAQDWVGYALAVSTFVGLTLEQNAYAAGPLPWAVATANTVNPVASYAVGVLAFRVSLPADPGTLAGIAAAGALITLGAVGLAHSPSVRVWSPQTDRGSP